MFNLLIEQGLVIGAVVFAIYTCRQCFTAWLATQAKPVKNFDRAAEIDDLNERVDTLEESNKELVRKVNALTIAAGFK